MDANEFIAKLKASGTENDWCDIQEVIEQYKLVSSKLNTKNKCSFSLNILCILCRNIEKVPTWRDSTDTKQMLMLSIDCVRETRGSDRSEQVKTLACVYHIHKYVIKPTKGVPPELVLKLSFMPFENDSADLLQDYYKTYWNIIADRLTYLEKLKANRMPIIKLLPKLTEDIVKVTQIYDTVLFCSNILTFIVKKLHYLYSDTHAKDINETFGKLFETITKKTDLQSFKTLKPQQVMDIYLKFNECFYVIADNSVKIKFKDSVLNSSVRCCLTLLVHNPDIFHCLQTFYLNAFCCLLTENSNTIVIKTIVNSCKMTEKLGYAKAMTNTYPYLTQLLRLYIEFITSNSDKISWKENFNENLQESYLHLIEFLMSKLENTPQISKCDACPVKSGLHDALRISFLVRNFVSTSIAQGLPMERISSVYHIITLHQHEILEELRSLGCGNYEKCYRKLQTDIHNTSISLNKAKCFEFSIKLFDVYLENEIKNFRTDLELKNMSRALYNKSICELDHKKYENALRNAYLSFVLAVPESLKSEKYMSLVMDIKAKVSKQQLPEKDDDDEEKEEEVKNDDLQLLNVLEACKQVIENSVYAKLKPILTHLKFSELLKHEFCMYIKLWPSIVPVAGVWKALFELSLRKHPEWMLGDTSDSVYWTLYEVIFQTARSVRTINSEYYVAIVNQLITEFERNKPTDTMLKIVHATLLALQCELNLAKATQKYGWNNCENTVGDLGQVRTVPQEYEAILPGLDAVDIWTEVLASLDAVPPAPILRDCLKIASVLVAELNLLYQTAPGLQLAYVCCKVADHLGDHKQYLQNFSVILSHCRTADAKTVDMLNDCFKRCRELMDSGVFEVPAMFLCDAAIYYNRCGDRGLSARLTRFVQAKVLSIMHKEPKTKLDLVVGRLLDAQTQLVQDSMPSTLSAISSVQRHYIAIPNTATSWLHRRLTALVVSCHTARTTLASVAACRRLRAWARARAAGVAARGALARGAVVLNTVNCSQGDDAQIKIDNRLKYIIGLQPSNEIQTQTLEPESKIKQQMFTPKQNRLETMLEHVVYKKTQTSPTLACVAIPAFSMPEFMNHKQDCTCYSCKTPYCLILAYQTFGLEAAVYFRAKEADIAKNYFEGVLNSFKNIKNKIEMTMRGYEQKFDSNLVDIVRKEFLNDLRKCHIDVLTEAAYFELSLENHEKADRLLEDIQKSLENDDDAYVKNEILNLKIALLQTRNKTDTLNSLELEMESLKLTPTQPFKEPLKTPEAKAVKPPKLNDAMIVKDDELPKLKRKVIKLNLDDDATEENTRKTTTRSNRSIFKIPVPVTSRACLETIGTPIPVKTKPNICITGASDEKKLDMNVIFTPKPKDDSEEFFTPNATCGEQFFTPSSSIKTYAQKSLRQNIIKNLENEFSTPKAETSVKETAKGKSDVPSKSRRTLKRATSPGKIVKEEKSIPVRSRRLRPAVNLSVDKEDKC